MLLTNLEVNVKRIRWILQVAASGKWGRKLLSFIIRPVELLLMHIFVLSAYIALTKIKSILN